MKKIITFALLMTAFVPMNAQSYLFDGIYSGMTSENYIAYCTEHFELSENGDYIVKLGGNSYFITPLKNSDQVIAAVVLDSYFIYGSKDYNEAMLSTANQIKSVLLSLNYEQTIDSWPLMSDIEDDNSKIAYSSINGKMQAFIGIYRLNNDNFRLLISIYDNNYYDETEGF
jgi:hypothetical protein